MADCSREKKHSFVWNELLSIDVEADKKFYTEVFGWEAETVNMPSGAYTRFLLNGEYIAGMMQNCDKDAKKSIWVSYVTVEDVEQSLNKAVSSGANIIVPKMLIENIGIIGMVNTKSGSLVGFFQTLPQS